MDLSMEDYIFCKIIYIFRHPLNKNMQSANFNLAYFFDYNVCFWIKCYKVFHIVLDICHIKTEIQNDRKIYTSVVD